MGHWCRPLRFPTHQVGNPHLATASRNVIPSTWHLFVAKPTWIPKTETSSKSNGLGRISHCLRNWSQKSHVNCYFRYWSNSWCQTRCNDGRLVCQIMFSRSFNQHFLVFSINRLRETVDLWVSIERNESRVEKFTYLVSISVNRAIEAMNSTCNHTNVIANDNPK